MPPPVNSFRSEQFPGWSSSSAKARLPTDTGIHAIGDAMAAKEGACRSGVLKALGSYPLVTNIDEAADNTGSIQKEYDSRKLPVDKPPGAGFL